MTTASDDAQSGARFVSIQTNGDVMNCRAAGPSIGAREAEVISADLCSAIDGHPGKLKAVVFDLSEIEFMNSMGLGMCIQVRNTAHAKGAKTGLVGLNAELAGLFDMMKIAKLFTIVKNEKQLAKLVK